MTQEAKWSQNLEAQIESQRDQLRARDPQQIAVQSGAYWDAGLTLTFLQMPLHIRPPDYTVTNAEGDALPLFLQALLIAYLVTADGTPRAGEWIAFRELPNGLFYHQAFTGYTGHALVRSFGNDLEAFRRGAKACGGGTLTGFGDAAYEFQVLPRLWICAQYWRGDEEDGLPPQANLLFDRAASRYLITDGLAIIGSHLTRRIIKAAR